MARRAAWFEGKSELNLVDKLLNGPKYCQILEKEPLLLFETNQMDKNVYLFQEDGAPCHKSKIAKACKELQGIKSLLWVAQSPDMNPIEHIWEHLDWKLQEGATKIMSVETLQETLLKKGQNTDQITVNNLIKSMKNQIKALKLANGGSIPY